MNLGWMWEECGINVGWMWDECNGFGNMGWMSQLGWMWEYGMDVGYDCPNANTRN